MIALYDYKSQRGDELDLVKGDQIKVLVKENESWWMGELIRNKQEGYFPANYVQDKSIYENLNRGPISPIKIPSRCFILFPICLYFSGNYFDKIV